VDHFALAFDQGDDPAGIPLVHKVDHRFGDSIQPFRGEADVFWLR
jgi:hypothetical protein